MAEPAVILVLHDVAPHTWADYRDFVAEVDALGGVPITWLVVPDFHLQHALEQAEAFCRVLEGRLARGDELVLHGYLHCDEGPAPRSPREWFLRRVYTHEAEFLGLDEAEAERRLAAGMALFQRHGWPLHGFVPPGWLLGAGGRRALARSGLRYTSDPRHFLLLPDFQPVAAPALVWSAGAAWRRGLSKMVCDLMRRRYREAPVIRLALHPEDMRHVHSRGYWLATLRQLLDEGRVPMTKIGWLTEHTRLASVA